MNIFFSRGACVQKTRFARVSFFYRPLYSQISTPVTQGSVFGWQVFFSVHVFLKYIFFNSEREINLGVPVSNIGRRRLSAIPARTNRRAFVAAFVRACFRPQKSNSRKIFRAWTRRITRLRPAASKARSFLIASIWIEMNISFTVASKCLRYSRRASIRPLSRRRCLGCGGNSQSCQ